MNREDKAPPTQDFLPEELNTWQAAEALHVSQSHVVGLIEKGDLPSCKVGTHCRVKREDLISYKEARDRSRREALTELTRLSEEAPGGYL